jgi:hypothetical protein
MVMRVRFARDATIGRVMRGVRLVDGRREIAAVRLTIWPGNRAMLMAAGWCWRMPALPVWSWLYGRWKMDQEERNPMPGVWVIVGLVGVLWAFVRAGVWLYYGA